MKRNIQTEEAEDIQIDQSNHNLSELKLLVENLDRKVGKVDQKVGRVAQKVVGVAQKVDDVALKVLNLEQSAFIFDLD